jgi:drug/metabolite transporter (DMT)-like permease
MSWFFFALAGPFLYALTNHIDKILLQKYFKHSGVGTLILISSLLSALALPCIYFFDPTVISVGMNSIAVMCLVGVLNALVIWLYLLALRDDEASIVIVFYQLVPVLGAILGYYFLGEILTKGELIAMAIIILGTTIVSFEIDSDNKFKLRKQTVLLMLGASFCWAAGSVVFKAVALDESVLRTLFWENVSLTLIGIAIFTFVKKYRINFVKALRTNSKPILALNLSNEILYITGNFVFGFAYMMAPIGLILLMNSFQPIFVFAIGIFMTLFFPKITVEKIHMYHVMQKGVAILVTGVGVYMLLG